MKWQDYNIEVHKEWPTTRKVISLVCKFKGHDFDDRGRGVWKGRVYRHLCCLRCGKELYGFLRK